MERLTKRDTDGQAMMDCQKCEADWTGKHGKPMVDCTALYCRNRLKDRLAAYEDTGLTPEEALSMRMDMAIIRAMFQDADVERMKELTRADREGRVMMLPCRIGSTVYVLIQDSTIFYPETNGWYIGEDTIDVIAQDGFYLGNPEDGDFRPNDVIGEIVFLTRKEAEKALEAMKND